MAELISCRVYNQPGVLAAVAGFLAEKNINIRSVTLTEAQGENTSLMIVSVEGDNDGIATAADKLHAFEKVLDVERLDKNHYLDRELLLVKVIAKPSDIPLLMQILESMRATVSAMGRDTITIEMTGNQERISALLKLLEQFDIREYARSGPVAVSKMD